MFGKSRTRGHQRVESWDQENVEDIRGNSAAICINVDVSEGSLGLEVDADGTISHIKPGSIAASAGNMQLGDTIVQVNGRSTLGEKSFDEMCAGETQLTLIAMRKVLPKKFVSSTDCQ